MNNCEGCKLGIQNQLGHIDGCLKEVDEEVDIVVYDGINTDKESTFFKHLFENISYHTENGQQVNLYVHNKMVHDILSGRNCKKVSYYTFYLKIKGMNVILKPFKNM